MKILLEKYPKGTYKGQMSDGKYIDRYLYENLKVMAKRIVNDMTFLGIMFSSTLEVGTGKSVLATQIGEAWSEVMREVQGIDIPWGIENVVWRPKELIERAFQVPKYSYLLLDEWEDATYWSELGMTLRTFFRKCRQLNLFIMVIIPNWFQMNIGYAISRSAFAIDVKFGESFTRGNFGFYGFDTKRDLYIKGKKEHNYKVVHPDFNGRFVDGYGVSEEEYRKAKLADIKKWEETEDKPVTKDALKKELCMEMIKNNPNYLQKDLAKLFNVTRQTIWKWVNKDLDTKSTTDEGVDVSSNYYTKNPSEKIIDWEEGEVLTKEEQKKPDEKPPL